ncbi:MAG: AAA family ATPase [Halofilum sp. (in: g-proteobacteria)]
MLERTSSALRGLVGRLRPADGGAAPSAAAAPSRTLTVEALQALGLQRQPFRDDAGADELFADEAIEMNLNTLAEQLRSGMMLPLLKGEPGSGKTSLLIQLMARAQQESQFFVCRAQPELTADRIIVDMLRVIARPVPADAGECFRQLARRLRTLVEQGPPAALVIDDAHLLSDRDLGHVLVAYDSLRKVLRGRFRLVLAADPSIELRLPQLRSEQLDAGQVIAASLRPLGRARLGPYLAWRLETAGAHPRDLPLTEEMLDRIAAASDDLPRSVETAATAELNAHYER